MTAPLACRFIRDAVAFDEAVWLAKSVLLYRDEERHAGDSYRKIDYALRARQYEKRVREIARTSEAEHQRAAQSAA